ncbi:hypothetical protein ACWEPC_37720 [Nonomuraea sp. NPDC004297]
MRPTGWRGALGEAYTEWTRRDGHAHLGIQAVYANTDPVELIAGEQETLRQNGQDVVNHGRRTVTHQGTPAVQWEFSWQAEATTEARWARPGTRYREIRRAVAIGDTAYVLSWTVAEGQWQRNRALMRQVINSFTVGA